MGFIIDFLSSLGSLIASLCDFLFNFLLDTLQMIMLVFQLPLVLGSVIEWTGAVGIAPYLMTLVGLAILYKILGREGG